MCWQCHSSWRMSLAAKLGWVSTICIIMYKLTATNQFMSSSWGFEEHQISSCCLSKHFKFMIVLSKSHWLVCLDTCITKTHNYLKIFNNEWMNVWQMFCLFDMVLLLFGFILSFQCQGFCHRDQGLQPDYVYIYIHSSWSKQDFM